MINKLIKIIISPLIIFVFIYFLILKIKKKKIIVLDLYEKQFKFFYLPIIEQVKKNHNFTKLSIFGCSALTDVFNKNDYTDLEVNFLFPSYFMKYLSNCDIFLSAHLYVEASKKIRRILISHGQTGKWMMAPKNIFSYFNTHFLCGELNKNQIQDSMQKYKISNKNIDIHKIGYPKLDKLFNREYNKSKIFNKFSLQEKPTIIFSPTWDKYLLLYYYGSSICEKILKDNYYNLIVRLHPSSLVSKNHEFFKLYTGGIEWKKVFQKFKNNKNFYFSDVNDNSNEILFISDLMITDASTIALEYILLKRPILYFSSDKFYDDYSPKFYKDYGNSDFSGAQLKSNPRVNCGRNFGTIFQDDIELYKFLDEFKDSPEKYRIKGEIEKDFIYNAGNSSKVASNKLYSYMNLN